MLSERDEIWSKRETREKISYKEFTIQHSIIVSDSKSQLVQSETVSFHIASKNELAADIERKKINSCRIKKTKNEYLERKGEVAEKVLFIHKKDKRLKHKWSRTFIGQKEDIKSAKFQE